MEPIFLTLEEVLESHAEQIAIYGGTAEIRDLGLLDSALAQPGAMFGGQFLHADIYEMAAINESAWRRPCCFWKSMALR
jgi:death-on-curing protein